MIDRLAELDDDDLDNLPAIIAGPIRFLGGTLMGAIIAFVWGLMGTLLAGFLHAWILCGALSCGGKADPRPYDMNALRKFAGIEHHTTAFAAEAALCLGVLLVAVAATNFGIRHTWSSRLGLMVGPTILGAIWVAWYAYALLVSW